MNLYLGERLERGPQKKGHSSEGQRQSLGKYWQN